MHAQAQSPVSRFPSPPSDPFLHHHHHHHHHHRPRPSSSLPLHLSPLFPTRRPLLSATHLLAGVATPPPELTQEEEDGAAAGEGPVELPPPSSSPYYYSSSSTSSIFATSDNPTPLQVTTSVLLTGATAVFLFRSLRRRAKRAKESRVRSSGVKDTKDIKQEALENLKLLSSASLDQKAPPSPAQAFLGALAAGAVALLLYKFTTTIEASLNRQAISDNYSVRQLTITIRTIVNGLCYLATCVFGVNSIGLLLYSLQLAFKSLMEPGSTKSMPEQNDNDSLLNTSVSMGVSTTDKEAGNSNNTQKNGQES